MVSRRKIFGFAAATPFLAVAPAVASANKSDAPDQELMRLTQGNNSARMYLTAKPEKEEPREVGLAVGKDGNLWLKYHVNNTTEWKRIVVE